MAMSLEDLEKKIYSRQYQKRKVNKKFKRHEDFIPHLEKTDFDEVSEKPVNRFDFSNWRKLAGILVGVFVFFSIILGGFYLWRIWISGGVSLEINVPIEPIRLGVPFIVRIGVNNDSGNLIDNTRVSLSLPDGLVAANTSRDQRILTMNLNRVADGSIGTTEFNLVAISGSQTAQQFEAQVIYTTSTLGSEFQVQKKGELVLEDPVISLDLETPRKVFSGERFTTKLTYTNKSETDTLKNVQIALALPAEFDLIKANPQGGDLSVWTLGDLDPGDRGDISIEGVLKGPADSFFNLSAQATADVGGQIFVINEKTASLSIEASPLALSVHVNDSQTYITSPEDILNYVIVYKNNTAIGLKDAIVRAELSGEMFDFSTLKSNGFFDSRDNSIIWKASSQPSLKLVSPGSSGTISFSVVVKKDYPITKLSDHDFVLRVSAQIESPTVPEGVAAIATIGVAEVSAKVAGRAELETSVLFRDAKSGFLNIGPWPPKINQPTQFTVHWRIKNYATDIKEAVIRGSLAPGVKFTDNVKSTINSIPQFNDRTNEIVWEIGQVTATKGILSEPVEAVFQIELVPSAINLGSFAALINQTTFTALDDFTSKAIQSVGAPVTTNLKSDPTVKDNEGKVIE